MKLLIRIFDFYLDASVHVAIAVFSLLKITDVFLGIASNEHLAFYAFFATIACYNFVKYGVEAEKYILVANRYHKNIQFFSFIALAFALYHAYFLNIETWIGIAFLMVLTGLYALPVLPAGQRLRSLGLLKILLVSIIWAGTTVVLPILSLQIEISWDIGIETLQRVVLVLVLLLPFEIRDLKYDRPELQTLPQRLGVANTKIFGTIATLAFFFMTFLKDELSELEIITKGVLFLMLIGMLVLSKKEQSGYFSSFWVEAIPILWWGIVWFLSGNY